MFPCISVLLSFCLSVFQSSCLLVYLSTHLLVHLSTCSRVFKSFYLHFPMYSSHIAFLFTCPPVLLLSLISYIPVNLFSFTSLNFYRCFVSMYFLQTSHVFLLSAVVLLFSSTCEYEYINVCTSPDYQYNRLLSTQINTFR